MATRKEIFQIPPCIIANYNIFYYYLFLKNVKDNPNSYFRSLCEDELRPKREKMSEILKDIGLDPIVPDGGYFMIANMTPLKKFINEEELDDSTDPWDYKGFFLSSRKISPFLHYSGAMALWEI